MNRIPQGYRAGDLLRQDATHSVLLLHPEQDGAPVVFVQFQSDVPADDPARLRFLRSSEWQSNCRHPNVIAVLERGEQSGCSFVILEHAAGGNLGQRLEQGMSVGALAEAAVAVGQALDRMHGLGIVHGNVSPASLQFRTDGTVVLGEFGASERLWPLPADSGEGTASDPAASLTTPTADERPATGQPHDAEPAATELSLPLVDVDWAFASPERLEPRFQDGLPCLDGRADVYSLTAVLHAALSGEPPFGTGDAATIAARRRDEPAPRLPSHLEALQRVVTRGLARQPADRYATATELATAFANAVAAAGLQLVVLRAAPVAIDEINAVGTPVLQAARRPRAEGRPKQRWRDRTGVRAVTLTGLLFAIVWGGSEFIERSETAARVLAIVGLVRDPAVQEAWEAARSLHADPNQRLASVVAGYRRVLSLDPSDTGAGAALAELASEWRRSVERALAQGNLTLAENRLAEYLLVFPADAQLAELGRRIADRRTADTLVTNALALLRTHGIEDPAAATQAIRSYQEVLRLVPEHPVAQTELDVLAGYYARLAADAVARGDMAAAIVFVDRASSANGSLPALMAIRQIVRGAATTGETLAILLDEAAAYRAAGALIDPPGANAAERYHRVLATDPDNVAALAGINAVVDGLIANVKDYVNAGDLFSASELVARATEIGLDQATVRETRERLAREMARFDTIVRNLEEGAALFEQGFITEPADRNAVQLLREVAALDPGNRSAVALLERCARRLDGVAREAWSLDMKNLARSYLARAIDVAPEGMAERAEWQATLDGWNGRRSR